MYSNCGAFVQTGRRVAASVQHVVLSLLHKEQAKVSYYLRYVYLQFDEVDLCTYNRL